MNVYEEAHNLSRAIKESGEFREFDSLRKEIEADEQINQMLADFHKMQFELQAAQMSGQQPDANALGQMQNVYAMLMTKPKAAEFLQAEMRFSIMMKDVYEILADVMNLKM